MPRINLASLRSPGRDPFLIRVEANGGGETLELKVKPLSQLEVAEIMFEAEEVWQCHVDPPESLTEERREVMQKPNPWLAGQGLTVQPFTRRQLEWALQLWRSLDKAEHDYKLGEVLFLMQSHEYGAGLVTALGRIWGGDDSSRPLPESA